MILKWVNLIYFILKGKEKYNMERSYCLEFYKCRQVKSPEKFGQAARLGFFYSH
jgi:hypothetical protein